MFSRVSSVLLFFLRSDAGRLFAPGRRYLHTDMGAIAGRFDRLHREMDASYMDSCARSVASEQYALLVSNIGSSVRALRHNECSRVSRTIDGCLHQRPGRGRTLLVMYYVCSSWSAVATKTEKGSVFQKDDTFGPLPTAQRRPRPLCIVQSSRNQ